MVKAMIFVSRKGTVVSRIFEMCVTFNKDA